MGYLRGPRAGRQLVLDALTDHVATEIRTWSEQPPRKAFSELAVRLRTLHRLFVSGSLSNWRRTFVAQHYGYSFSSGRASTVLNAGCGRYEVVWLCRPSRGARRAVTPTRWT